MYTASASSPVEQTDRATCWGLLEDWGLVEDATCLTEESAELAQRDAIDTLKIYSLSVVWIAVGLVAFVSKAWFVTLLGSLMLVLAFFGWLGAAMRTTDYGRYAGLLTQIFSIGLAAVSLSVILEMVIFVENGDGLKKMAYNRCCTPEGSLNPSWESIFKGKEQCLKTVRKDLAAIVPIVAGSFSAGIGYIAYKSFVLKEVFRKSSGGTKHRGSPQSGASGQHLGEPAEGKQPVNRQAGV